MHKGMPKHHKTRKVVDSNFLQTEELRSFLSASPFHLAVLTEFAAMEAYKNDALRSVPLSMSVLLDFPRQIVVLKGAEITSALTSPVSNPQIRLIDQEQTTFFPAYCRALKLADLDPRIRARMVALGKQADTNMARMIEQASIVTSSIPGMLSIFSDSDRRALRSDEPLPRTTQDKLGAQVLQLTAHLLRRAGVTEAPSFDALLDTWIFRQTFCIYIWMLRTMDGVVPSNPGRIRNDIIDATYAAYATMFDGLLSKDKLPNEIYAVAKGTLIELKR